MREAERRPMAYSIILIGLAALGTIVVLIALGVPPFDNFAVFILSQIAAALTLLVFGVIGGAFVGMLVAHRILANRDFTPFEKAVMAGLDDLRLRLDRLEAKADDVEGAARETAVESAAGDASAAAPRR